MTAQSEGRQIAVSELRLGDEVVHYGERAVVTGLTLVRPKAIRVDLSNGRSQVVPADVAIAIFNA